ncbi:Cathepsin_L [Hexamita inflata]|uniref:Cathepsin L n=1 Tax=Hexamita inflata TaxID=28002 RepID=A0AA86R3U8_9EUKA|nr:Cathepsin L [Hexamita inflata]CAI9965642.1 Cathepsin L [Hexamita inflata]
MIVLSLLLQLDLQSMTCEDAFTLYKQQFGKSYAIEDEHEKKTNFCTNFKDLQTLLTTDPALPVGLVERMDIIENLEELKRSQQSILNPLNVAKSEYCTAVNPLPDIDPYPSVDLREMQLITSAKDQGQCSGCYIFQTMAVLENAVLRDKKNLNAFWQSKANSQTLSLSEQYQLSNGFCTNCKYCRGGNFIIQTYIMVPNNKQQENPVRAPITTVELSENFKYDYVANQAAWTAGTVIPPKLAPENYLLPVKMVPNNGLYAGWCNENSKVTPTIQIFDDDATTFNASTIKTIKSYLSRGIAVAATMHVGSGDDAILFKRYTGGSVLYSPCPVWDADHAVVIVGYGIKNGKNVWVIKNSWGTSWGDNGFFYVEIGTNSYCTEWFAYTVLPKYFNMTDPTPYPRGTLNRGTKFTLDCDERYTNISSVVTCYGTCPPTHPTFIVGQKQCLDACPAGQTCQTTCASQNPFLENGRCVSRCATGAYKVIGSDLVCQSICSGMYIVNVSNLNSKQCILQCPNEKPFYEVGACVSKCTSTMYSIVQGDQKLVCQSVQCTFYVLNASNGNSKQCLAQCPATSPFSESNLCSSRCSSGAYQNQSGNLVCTSLCTQFYIINETNAQSKLCVTACPSNYNMLGNVCVIACPAPTFYNDSRICSTKCSSGIYQRVAQTFVCVASCPGMYLQNPNNKECISACPYQTPYYQTGQCVDRCKTSAYQLVGKVLTCQASCSYYVLNATNNYSQQCLASCTKTTPYSDDSSIDSYGSENIFENNQITYIFVIQ